MLIRVKELSALGEADLHSTSHPTARWMLPMDSHRTLSESRTVNASCPEAEERLRKLWLRRTSELSLG